jgi:DNA-binding CsgD family transcriptional regulator
MIDAAVRPCIRISYKTAAEAREAHRTAKSHFGMPLKAVLCKTCATWHLSFPHALTARELAVLRELAFGFRDHEIGQSLGLTKWQVVRTHRELTNKLGALSRGHLIAVAVSIGVINIFESENPYASNRTSNGRHQPRTPRSGEQRSNARG